MHTVIVQYHIGIWKMAISTRVPIWSQQHGFCCIQQPKLDPPLPPLTRSCIELFDLRHVHLQVKPFEPRLVSAERPLPQAIPPFIPLAPLKMCRRECSKEHSALKAREVVERPECGSKSLPISIVVGQVGDIATLAIVAPDELIILIEHGRPEEPLADGYNDDIKFLYLGGPIGVGLVQI